MCKIFFLPLFLFFFLNYRGENITKIETTNEYPEKNIYENNKKEFNIKGHLSISSGVINAITLSPLWGMLCLTTSTCRIYNDFIYEVFSNVCCFHKIF